MFWFIVKANIGKKTILYSNLHSVRGYSWIFPAKKPPFTEDFPSISQI